MLAQRKANGIASLRASLHPFVTVALVKAARELEVEHYIGITASVDTFYEGQERTDSANPYLMRSLHGITEEYRRLNILNYEMECGTLFKMAGVYNFAAAAICGVVASRTVDENIILEQRDIAIKNAIATAVNAAASFE
ncbi:phosphorylase family protein [Nostoc sp.]|uniref:phosphorylase family protein n=1 Tax=Nostoc sp. TaxID=1180 RepID=UPI002FF8D998